VGLAGTPGTQFGLNVSAGYVYTQLEGPTSYFQPYCRRASGNATDTIGVGYNVTRRCAPLPPPFRAALLPAVALLTCCPSFWPQ
jgi:hypothetical protein